jgi:hypothetical protein
MEQLVTLEIKSKHAKSRCTAKEDQMFSFLRHQAFQEKRRIRNLCGLPDNAEELPSNAHMSELVRMSSCALKRCRMNDLLSLLNNNGIAKYTIL